MKHAASDKEFPQFTENSTEGIPGVQDSTLEGMRISPAVHHRPSGLKNSEITENGVLLTFGTAARKSVLSYTHETALHLYKPAEALIDTVYMHIELWSDSVFRTIRFTETEKQFNNNINCHKNSGLPVHRRRPL